MADLKFIVNTEALTKGLEEYRLDIENDLQKSMSTLAASTHAKVTEWAQQELHSSREKFINSLGFEEVMPGVWIISVDESGLFVEDGLPEEFDMKLGLLAKNAKTSKSGTRYKVIPFKYNIAPSAMTPKTAQLVSYLKQELRKEKIPFKKIEVDENGSPKIGKLHQKDFGNPGGRLAYGKASTPVLNRLTVIQSMGSDNKVHRNVMTFRTVSSGQKSAGKWIHPGVAAKNYLDRALSWAESEFENTILPEVLNKYK